jgi:hypothetical protein
MKTPHYPSTYRDNLSLNEAVENFGRFAFGLWAIYLLFNSF